MPSSLSGFAVVLVLSACSSAQPKRSAEETDLAALADRYFEEVFFKYSPTRGTAAGLHQYDSQLEDFSRSSIDAHVAVLNDFQGRFEYLHLPAGSPDAAADRELLLSDIRATLLELTTIRRWERDPDVYSSGISGSAFVIMSRKFASPDERLRSLVEREKQMPAVLDAARQNLENPPRWYTSIALEQLPGIISFFEKDVPAAFQEAKDADVLRAFAQANGRVVSALRAYQQFLEKELLPRSNGDYRIGAENFRKKLLFEEEVDLPLDHLLEVGMADLRRNQREFQRAARQLRPDRTPEQVLQDLGADHPPPGELLQAFRDTFGDLRRFIEEHRIVTVPSPVLPIVEETPPFMRATTIASMEPPGPFEKRATEAFFRGDDEISRQGGEVDLDVDVEASRFQLVQQHLPEPLQVRPGCLQTLIVQLTVLQPEATVGEDEDAVGAVAQLDGGPQPGKLQEQLDVPALRGLLQQEVLRWLSDHGQPPPFPHVSRSGTIRLNTGAPSLESLGSAK